MIMIPMSVNKIISEVFSNVQFLLLLVLFFLKEGENFPLTESSDKTSSKSKPRKEKRNDDKKLKSKIPSDSVVEISELSQADAKIEHVISSSIDQNLSMPKRKNKPRKNKTMPKTDDPTVSVNESKTISYVLEG